MFTIYSGSFVEKVWFERQIVARASAQILHRHMYIKHMCTLYIKFMYKTLKKGKNSGKTIFIFGTFQWIQQYIVDLFGLSSGQVVLFLLVFNYIFSFSFTHWQYQHYQQNTVGKLVERLLVHSHTSFVRITELHCRSLSACVLN